ncbi:hypothetical protein ACTJKN_02740 [Pedobacter sp. 22163]|uniref:hypothetical protein n=1 Tax=Pedobacter sp. 22163 TaxID=3453883 RepID=UPI003F872595
MTCNNLPYSVIPYHFGHMLITPGKNIVITEAETMKRGQLLDKQIIVSGLYRPWEVCGGGHSSCGQFQYVAKRF